jgi:hypothetical protein
MLYDLIIAGAGILGLLALWLGVQSLARRHGAANCEGPEHTVCNACAPDRADSCSLRLNDSNME